ncbi:hypothetical protein LZ30DRAFT_773155 [Colletotrichum cereale]|nr:hypothetical protein LZ30DRAFT_773155 [Colletotrichum cereale]
MFGTLMYDMQHKEPTFIKNNPESVINRNRRGKPHVACEYCRGRKLRCNGDPSGCDRCKSSSNICSYPKNRNIIRKNKSSSSSATGTPKSRQATLDVETVTRPSPAFSNSLELDPALLFVESNETHESTKDMSILQDQGGLLSHSMNSESAQLGTNSKDRGRSLQHSKQEEDQIDQWLASCNLLSPSGTVDMTIMEGGDYCDPWQEQGKDTSYYDLVEDSDEVGLSSQETQLNSEMNEGTDVVDDSLTTSLSSSSLDMFLEETFMTQQPKVMLGDQNPARKAQSSQRVAPVAYKMSAPTAMSPMSALIESDDTRSECRCLELAAHLIERLGNESVNTEVPTMDGLLNCCREAIKGCNSILCCALCKSRSESMMLLAMAGQYLSNICEKTVRCYIDVTQQTQSPRTPFTGGSAIWFRLYKVESSSEQVQILRLLVMGQLTEFCQLITKIKSRVGTRKAHMAPLLGAERKIQCMRALLMKCDRELRKSATETM